MPLKEKKAETNDFKFKLFCLEACMFVSED